MLHADQTMTILGRLIQREIPQASSQFGSATYAATEYSIDGMYANGDIVPVQRIFEICHVAIRRSK